MHICIKCRHCSTTDPNLVWYEYLCRAPDVQAIETVDPVTGKRSYQRTNDLGATIYGGQKSPYCRYVNKEGKCPFYKDRDRG